MFMKKTIPLSTFFIIFLLFACSKKNEVELEVKIFDKKYSSETLPLSLKLELFRIQQEAYEKTHLAIRQFAVRGHLSNDFEDPPPLEKILRPTEDISIQAKNVLKGLDTSDLSEQERLRVLKEIEHNIYISQYLQTFSEVIEKIEQDGNLSIGITPPLIPSGVDFKLNLYPTFGRKQNPHHIYMFTSYACESCRNSSIQLSRLIKEFPDKIFVTLFLLPAAEGSIEEMAIRIGECAHRYNPDFFWTFHSQLIADNNFTQMAESTSITAINNFKKAELKHLETLGASREKLNSCLESSKLENGPNRVRALAKKLSVNEFPRFIINRRLWSISGQGIYADIKDLIEN